MKKTTARILLVEDDRILRRAVQTTLRRHGFNVVAAGDGEKALRLAKTEVLRLVLLELIIPKVQAVRVLQREGVLSKEEDPLSKVRVFRGKGCQQCNGSGFRGRLGIFELFEIDDQFRQMIIERRGSSLIRAAAIEKGMKTMLQDGLAKAFLGETTLDEVLRVAI